MSIISVIMPVRNLAEYIQESIDSVQNQTFADWELLVIDDGSTDATAKIVKSMTRDARIRYYWQEWAGVSAARNRGLDLATGDYITFLDGDDLWHPTFLEKSLIRIEQENSDFVYCKYYRLYSNSPRRSLQLKTEEFSDTDEMTIIKFLNRNISLLMGNIMLSKKLFSDQVRFSEGCRLGEDEELICKALVMAKRTGFINEELFFYRCRASSITQQGRTWKLKREAIEAWERAIGFFRLHYFGPRKNETCGLVLNYLYYQKYRYLYNLIKYNHYQELRYLLTNEQWLEALRHVIQNFKSLDRFKAKIVSNNNQAHWQLLTWLYSFKRLLANKTN